MQDFGIISAWFYFLHSLFVIGNFYVNTVYALLYFHFKLLCNIPHVKIQYQLFYLWNFLGKDKMVIVHKTFQDWNILFQRTMGNEIFRLKLLRYFIGYSSLKKSVEKGILVISNLRIQIRQNMKFLHFSPSFSLSPKISDFSSLFLSSSRLLYLSSPNPPKIINSSWNHHENCLRVSPVVIRPRSSRFEVESQVGSLF